MVGRGADRRHQRGGTRRKGRSREAGGFPAIKKRITMIRKALEEERIQLPRIWIIPVPDVHQHSLWVSQIVGYSPKFGVVYANEPLTRRLFMEAGFRVETMPLIKREVYLATEIRKRMSAGEEWEKLVPSSVVKFIKEIDGDVRLRDLNKTDKVD